MLLLTRVQVLLAYHMHAISRLVAKTPPVTIYTVSAIAGILWQAGYGIYAIICGALCVGYCFIIVSPAHITILLLSFLLGSLRYASREATTLTYILSVPKGSVTVTGTIMACESLQQHKTALTVQLNRLTHAANKAPCHGLHKAYVKVVLTNPIMARAGDTIIIDNTYIHAASIYPTPHYTLRSSIIGTIYCKGEQCTLLPTSPTLLDITRTHVQEKIQSLLSPEAYQLFTTIFLGASPKTMFSQRVAYMSWGISHYLARSGLHLVLLAGIIYWCMMILPLSLYIKRGITACFILIYSLLSTPSISFVRACIMLGCHISCFFIHIPAHTMHILSLTTLAILAYNPVYLFCLDFQLSFFLTYALILCTRPIHES